MSPEGPVDTHSREPDKVSREACSQSRATASVAAVIRSVRSGQRAIPALMDLELPRFAAPDESGVDRVYRSQWVMTCHAAVSGFTGPTQITFTLPQLGHVVF